MITYNKIVEFLTSKERFHIDLGLENTKLALDLLGNPQNSLKCIQVAGTNGKGSVCAILESILREAGFKTGLFTSPHIFQYMERIKISGIEISAEDLYEYLIEINLIAEKNGIQLTEFELLTVVMFKYFADNNVEIAILETGLGGRFDATNVIEKNLCSIITHIDLDHTERLGDTKEKIAYEKAGIIKSGCPIITSEGYEAIKDTASEKDSLFILKTPYAEPRFIKALSLKGVQQQENLSLALEAISLLFPEISEEIILRGLSTTTHICRFQYIKDKNLIVDGAHNPNGIDILNRNLTYYYPNKKKQFVFGALKNKDYQKMLDILFSFQQYEDTPPKIYFYKFNSENACDYTTLRDSCIYFSRELKDIDTIEYSDDVLTVFCGSFYMLPELISKEDINKNL